jgi:hypothetical protein
MRKGLLFAIVSGILTGFLVPDKFIDFSFEWWSFIILGNILFRIIYTLCEDD